MGQCCRRSRRHRKPAERHRSQNQNVKTDQSKLLKVDGVFIAIGHHPNTELFRDSLKLDKDGYIITEPNSGKTNIEGVFAAGDVKDPYYRQAVIAAASGCIAALEAEKYLVSKNKYCFLDKPH